MQATGPSVIAARREDPLKASSGRVKPTSPSPQRTDLLRQAASHEAAAQAAAATGDIETAGRLILQALDCERRAGGVGPQVLQLIKPRD